MMKVENGLFENLEKGRTSIGAVLTMNGIRRVTISKKGAAYPAIRSIALVNRK